MSHLNIHKKLHFWTVHVEASGDSRLELLYTVFFDTFEYLNHEIQAF